MKILMAGWGFDKKITGGMDIHITHLVKNLCAQGAEIHLILPEENAPQNIPKNLTIHKIDTNAKDPEELDKKYTSAITTILKSTDFDIIHTHDWFGVTAANRHYNKSKSPRWIHTVHSLEYMRCAKDAPTKSKISEIEKTAIKESDIIITVSSLMKQKIQTHYNTNPKKINIIYNYTSQLPKAPETKQEIPTVLCTSRLTFQKGIEYLIHASTGILKQIPDCRFIIIGDGHLKESLKDFAKTLGVQNSFEFPGFVQDKELAAYFRSATLFIMPSIHEPFGIACLDAIDSNLPVILSENVGAKELFKGCTLTHKPSSSEDITKNTIKLLKDKKLQDTLKNKAKQKLNQIDNWNSIAKKTMAIYTSV